jgi:single-stranded-DNA-specific exonuclease RecJ
MDVLAELFSILARKKAGSSIAEAGEALQLAALGSIADLMPLRDENRIIVKRGVEALASSPRKGMRELLKALGLGRSLNATEIAWQITPLINAAGRVGSPEIALRLLMSDDPAERNQAVEDIQGANNERKRIGAEVWEVVYPLAGEMFQKSDGRYILVGSPLVKSGITGLLASRVVGVFKVPAIVVAFREDGTAVGSVRSSNGFKISGLLASCAEFFIDYGGHDSAAGFSLKLSDWDAFAEKAKAYMDAAEITIAEESITIDAELPHSYLRPEIRKTCEIFEPFGEENRSLVFLARNVPMVDAQIVGKSAKSHLKLTLDFGQYKWIFPSRRGTGSTFSSKSRRIAGTGRKNPSSNSTTSGGRVRMSSPLPPGLEKDHHDGAEDEGREQGDEPRSRGVEASAERAGHHDEGRRGYVRDRVDPRPRLFGLGGDFRSFPEAGGEGGVHARLHHAVAERCGAYGQDGKRLPLRTQE